MRLFVAIDLPMLAVAELDRVRTAVSRSDARWESEKWVASENLHITLKFLGDVDPEGLPDVRLAVDRAVAEAEQISLDFGGLRAVPSGRRAQMVWATWRDQSGSAGRLAARIDSETTAYGDATRRQFRAHATLCRARRPRALDRVVLDQAEGVLCREQLVVSDPTVSLIESRLTPRGPVYATIGTRRIGGE